MAILTHVEADAGRAGRLSQAGASAPCAGRGDRRARAEAAEADDEEIDGDAELSPERYAELCAARSSSS